MLKSYKELEIWKKGINLVKLIYNICIKFPKDETFGLTSQIKRAVVSIPSNIAEGYARNSTNEYIYHLCVARGSLAEVDTQLHIAIVLNFISLKETELIFVQIDEIQKMLSVIIQKLKNNSNSKP